MSFVSAIIASLAAIISSASGKTPSTPNWSAIGPAFIAPLATDFSSQCADVNEPTSFAFIIPSLITFEFTTGIPSSENAIAPASFIALKSTSSSPFSPFVIDENGSMIQEVQPPVVVDAILAKRNLGTKITDAPVVIGVGPGFCAGKDVDAVIETQRGHNLGRVIYEGEAALNTGIPGMIGGYAKERVIHAPATGKLHILRQIGEIVEAGDILADIEGTPVKTLISGVIRGMIREGYDVKKGLKIADVDPRVKEQENCYHISDKARCVAGGVLEAILHLLK